MKKISSIILILFIIGGCSKSGDKLQLPVEEVYEKVLTDNEFYVPRVDILFVIDSSGSMASHQANLINNIAKFTKGLESFHNLGFNIGVVSTDMDRLQDPAECCGALQGDPKFVSNRTPGLENILQANLNLGTSGSGYEKSFEPVLAALSPTLLNGINKGFYRKEAYLAVIFITDAEDQSSISPDQFYQALLKLKGRPERILAYGVLVLSKDDQEQCPRDEYDTKPTRIEAFLSKVVNTGENVFSLCDPNYGEKLAAISQDIVDRVGSTVFLSRIPVIRSIKVRYGALEIFEDPIYGWVYNREKNSLLFGTKIDWNSQPSGTELDVSYEAVRDSVRR